MNKIIIHIDSVSDEKALLCVSKVIAHGMTSERNGLNQYCFVTTFTDFASDFASKERIIVTASRKGDTHTFKVRKDE